MSETSLDKNRSKLATIEHTKMQLKVLREMMKNIELSCAAMHEHDDLSAMTMLYVSGSLGALIGCFRHVREELEQTLQKVAK